MQSIEFLAPATACFARPEFSAFQNLSTQADLVHYYDPTSDALKRSSVIPVVNGRDGILYSDAIPQDLRQFPDTAVVASSSASDLSTIGMYDNDGCWYPIPVAATAKPSHYVPDSSYSLCSPLAVFVPPIISCEYVPCNPAAAPWTPALPSYTKFASYCGTNVASVMPMIQPPVLPYGTSNPGVQSLISSANSKCFVQTQPLKPAATSELALVRYTGERDLALPKELSPHLHRIRQATFWIEMLYGPLKGVGVHNGRPTLLTPAASYRSPGLENVWRDHFAILFGLFDGHWIIAPALSPPSSGWLLFRDMAKVRFSCQKCMRGWTSMFGVVLFFYRWNPEQKCGLVRFLLMGQSCSKCAKQNVFLTPMWYPEEAQRVMTNFFYKICSKVYGQASPPMNQDRRHGRPRLQHNSGQCQGCVLGLCKPKKKLCIPDKFNEEMPEAGMEGHTDSSDTDVQRDACVQKAIDGVQKALAERARSTADVIKLGVSGAKCKVDGTNRAVQKEALRIQSE